MVVQWAVAATLLDDVLELRVQQILLGCIPPHPQIIQVYLKAKVLRYY